MHKKIYFVNVVWGDYVNFFINYHLPSLFAKDNLIYIAQKIKKCKLYIYTDKISKNLIKNSNSYKILNEIIEVNFIQININIKDKHVLLSRCHKNFYSICLIENAISFFLSPDTVWSNGSFKFCLTKIQEGYSSLLIPGLRVNKNSSQMDLDLNKKDGKLEIDSSTLNQIFFKNIHKSTLEYLFYDQGGILLNPSVILQRINNENFLINSFHSHPLFISHDSCINFTNTIDYDLANFLYLNRKKIFICTDSSEILVYEFSKEEMFYGGIFEKSDIDSLINYAISPSVKEHHLFTFTIDYFINYLEHENVRNNLKDIFFKKIFIRLMYEIGIKKTNFIINNKPNISDKNDILFNKMIITVNYLIGNNFYDFVKFNLYKFNLWLNFVNKIRNNKILLLNKLKNYYKEHINSFYIFHVDFIFYDFITELNKKFNFKFEAQSSQYLYVFNNLKKVNNSKLDELNFTENIDIKLNGKYFILLNRRRLVSTNLKINTNILILLDDYNKIITSLFMKNKFKIVSFLKLILLNIKYLIIKIFVLRDNIFN